MDGDGTGTVVLSGFGGDQVLAGDLRTPFHLADLLRIGSIGRLLDGLRAWQRADPNRRPLRYYAYRLAIQPAWRHRRGLALTPPEREESGTPGSPGPLRVASRPSRRRPKAPGATSR